MMLKTRDISTLAVNNCLREVQVSCSFQVIRYHFKPVILGWGFCSVLDIVINTRNVFLPLSDETEPSVNVTQHAPQLWKRMSHFFPW